MQGKKIVDVLKYLVTPASRAVASELSKVASIALTVPVHTADVERLFSAMKRVSYILAAITAMRYTEQVITFLGKILSIK